LNEQNDKRKKSGGPRSNAGKLISSQNSRKHGLFSKKLTFSDDGDVAEYSQLCEDAAAHFQPVGGLEQLLVKEWVAATWRTAKALELLDQQLPQVTASNLQPALSRFMRESGLPEVPVPGVLSDKTPHGVESNVIWECQELTLRMHSRDKEAERSSEENGEGKSDVETTGEQLEVKLRSPIDAIYRAHSTFQRCADKAIDRLIKFRQLRNTLSPNGKR
jgi:hypothetical protein